MRKIPAASALVFAAVLASLSISSVAQAFGRAQSGDAGNPAYNDCTRVPIPSADGVRVDLAHLGGFSDSQLDKVNEAAKIMQKVVNSALFREKVLGFEYKGQKQFVSTSMSNEEVYATILAAHESYTPASDGVAQLCLNLYTPPFWKKRSVVGYTYPGQPEIYMNSYYFNDFTPKQVAGNIAHEWMHKLGFEHDFNRTEGRDSSVPYAVGEMVIELADQFN